MARKDAITGGCQRDDLISHLPRVLEPGDGQVLAALGLGELEQRVYESLLESPDGSLTQIAAKAGFPERRAREIAASLEDKGLVSRSATKPARYVPASPKAALEVLILRRQEQLEEARLLGERLEGRFRRGAGRDAKRDIVEVVTGSISQREVQLLTSAGKEILALCMPPLKTPTEEWITSKLDLLGRGVRGRVVYSVDALSVPGMLDFIETMSPAGEEARTLPELPMNLVIVDRRAGLLPLVLTEPRDWLLVHESSLLDSLIILFEAMWEKAAPFPHLAGDTASGDGLDGNDQRLLGLLAMGMRDLAIAHQLGIGARTVSRRVSHIMDRLGTLTRFQTGFQLGRQRWNGEPPQQQDL